MSSRGVFVTFEDAPDDIRRLARLRHAVLERGPERQDVAPVPAPWNRAGLADVADAIGGGIVLVRVRAAERRLERDVAQAARDLQVARARVALLPDGRFLTQRQEHRLALVTSAIEADALRVLAPGRLIPTARVARTRTMRKEWQMSLSNPVLTGPGGGRTIESGRGSSAELKIAEPPGYPLPPEGY